MGSFLSDDDVARIAEDLKGMNLDLKSRSRFYLVVETKTGATSPSYDPIFGENVDPFQPVATSRVYQPFFADILTKDQDSDYNESGFSRQKTMDVSVDKNVYAQWKEGQLVSYEGVDYRISKVDRRGILKHNRFILTLDEVN